MWLKMPHFLCLFWHIFIYWSKIVPSCSFSIKNILLCLMKCVWDHIRENISSYVPLFFYCLWYIVDLFQFNHRNKLFYKFWHPALNNEKYRNIVDGFIRSKYRPFTLFIWLLKITSQYFPGYVCIKKRIKTVSCLHYMHFVSQIYFCF